MHMQTPQSIHLALLLLASPLLCAAQSLSNRNISDANLAEPALKSAVERSVERLSPVISRDVTTLAGLQADPLHLRGISLWTDQAGGSRQTDNKSNAPTLEDLGLSPEQTRGSAQDQARLDRRSHMLKIHQRLGLITTIPLAATILTSGLAGGRETSSTGRDLHAALGSATAGLYFTTAYFSIFAPRIPGTESRGQIRWHKTLAFIHGPGMILLPILGALAYEQKSRGERVHGIASAHGAVAGVTAVAYGLSIATVSFRW
jgi:hypothetical protein